MLIKAFCSISKFFQENKIFTTTRVVVVIALCFQIAFTPVFLNMSGKSIASVFPLALAATICFFLMALGLSLITFQFKYYDHESHRAKFKSQVSYYLSMFMLSAWGLIIVAFIIGAGFVAAFSLVAPYLEPVNF